MINSPYRYFISKDGSFDKTRNINSISRLLRYCTDRNITVIFGEYNPPTFDMKDSEKWVDMSVAYLKYLVCDLGFTCIKYFNILMSQMVIGLQPTEIIYYGKRCSSYFIKNK